MDPNKMKLWGVYGDAFGANANAVADTVKVKTAEWYHIVYTYENFKAKFYINGQLKAVHPYTAFSFIPNPGDLYLGTNPDVQYPYWFNGAIDDIRIYDRALCDGEVKQLNRLKD